MAQKPKRGPTVLDLMILIAAQCVAFKGYQVFETETQFRKGWPEPWYWRYDSFAIALAASALVSSLIPPRPSVRRLFRPPGIAVCLTLTVFTMGSMLLGYVKKGMRVEFMPGWPPDRWGILSPDFYVDGCLMPLPYHLGFVVAATWMTLAVSGRWRWTGGGWVNYLGFALGVYWVLATALLATGF